MTTLSVDRASTPTATSRRSASARASWMMGGLVLLVLAGVASVAFGVRSVGLDEIVGGVLGSTDTIGEAAVAKRVPRTVLAMLVGAALAVSGAVMQGVTRNPLADPGILGVTTGAALFVVAGIAFFGLASPTSYIWVAIAGAALAASFAATEQEIHPTIVWAKFQNLAEGARLASKRLWQ